MNVTPQWITSTPKKKKKKNNNKKLGFQKIASSTPNIDKQERFYLETVLTPTYSDHINNCQHNLRHLIPPFSHSIHEKL